MKKREEFHPDDLLDRAIEAVLRDSTSDPVSPDQMAELVTKVKRAAEKPSPITFLERLKNMKLTYKIAMGCAVLLAFVCLITWLVPGGGQAVAFADVVEALNNIHSATWKTTSSAKILNNQVSITINQNCMFLAPSHERTEINVQDHKEIMIQDGEKGKFLSLNPETKTALVVEYKNQPAGGISGQTFLGLRSLAEQAKSGKSGTVEKLGIETIEGRNAEGFRMEVGSIKVTIWADPKTLLPIRVEESTSALGSDIFIMMNDFQTEVKLDESLFSIEVPPGYTLEQTTQMDVSKKPVDYIVDALTWAVDNNDGVFPPELMGEHGLQEIMQKAMATWMEKYGKDSPEFKQKLADASMIMGVLSGALIALPPDTWHYAGKDVKLNTPDRPIFWFKLAKVSPDYQVIYADLNVKEATAEEVAKFPQ
jgi:outer membrane lipoprotein-sorting protein